MRHGGEVSIQFYAPFNPRAALWASLIAGLVFALLNTSLARQLRGDSPSTLLRMTAAIVLGPATLSSATLGVEVALVAILVHAALSIVYGMFLALVLPTVDRMWGVLIGAFYGLALYYMNFYGFSAFSWFVPGRDWASLASHVVFGTMLAYAYTLMSAPKVSGPACHRRERRRSVNPPGQGSIHKFGL